MPGIAGIINHGFSRDDAITLQSMVTCMMHEAFYTSGKYVDEQLGIGVGWVNHDRSFSDCMPVWNEAKDICLIFSGENFAEECEIDKLRQRGHQLNAENADYLVHCYEEAGLKFLENLNGWFSGLLMDFEKKTATLFNDRYGLSRLYYYQNEYAFYFASEAKCLLRIMPCNRRLNFVSLAELFSCGCVLQGRSLFEGISIFPQGSAWTFYARKSEAVKRFYFQREVWTNQEPLDEVKCYDELKNAFSRILPRYFNGRERVALSLTGGVDSRMVMAWAGRPAGSLPCFSFGGMFRDCRDVKLAREVARRCKQPHITINVDHDFLKRFSILAAKTVYITDGVMDVSGAAELYVNRIAREIAPVRLTGNYGGEILRRLVAFKPMKESKGLFDPEFERFLRDAANTYFRELNDQRLQFVVFKQLPWHHYSRMALERSQLTLRSPYLDNDLVSLVFKMPANVAKSKELSLRLIAEGNPALSDLATDRGVCYHPIPLATELLQFYQEFTFKAEYAYDYGMPDWLVKFDRALLPFHLEKLFLGRHKFNHFRLWYRDELSEYVKEVLLDAKSLRRPYINGTRLEEIVLEHVEGKSNHTSIIHRLMTVELIQRQLIEMR